MNHEQFVRIWQEAASLDEVCERSRLNKPQARNRAYHLRKLGVPLKRFGHVTVKADIDALKRIARESLPRR